MTPRTTPAARSAARSRRRPAWFALWPLLPLVIYLAVLFIYPVAQLLWLSVVDKQGNLTSLHYARLFASAVYVKVLGITFRIACWTTGFAMIADYPVAYLLTTATERTRNKGVDGSIGSSEIGTSLAGRGDASSTVAHPACS